MRQVICGNAKWRAPGGNGAKPPRDFVNDFESGMACNRQSKPRRKLARDWIQTKRVMLLFCPFIAAARRPHGKGAEKCRDFSWPYVEETEKILTDNKPRCIFLNDNTSRAYHSVWRPWKQGFNDSCFGSGLHSFGFMPWNNLMHKSREGQAVIYVTWLL